MKRKLLMAVVAMMNMTAWAQNIAVVNQSNTTTICQTLDEAISKATSGSVIYLPGGGFQIKDETKIDKKVTIMGVSHRGDTDNVDGATIISGNLNFDKGSSGSAVLGVYVSGNINVGTATDSVLNLTVRYCNVGSIQVKHKQSSGMVVNQCYLRDLCNFGNCNVRLENNIISSANSINGGIINHNVVTDAGNSVYHSTSMSYYYSHHPLNSVSNSTITNNFFLDISGGNSVSNCQIFSNCIGVNSWGDDQSPIVLDEGETFNDVFYAHKGVKISSDYRIKEKKNNFIGIDHTYIGIEGGDTGFDPNSLAPIPRIVSKKVDEQTDGSGKLNVKITVKSK
ncbi:MAG: hypothetical protein IKX36_07115 [Prevotella sp.]|nr:hypothetical protein [Prevotella sp.]